MSSGIVADDQVTFALRGVLVEEGFAGFVSHGYYGPFVAIEKTSSAQSLEAHLVMTPAQALAVLDWLTGHREEIERLRAVYEAKWGVLGQANGA